MAEVNSECSTEVGITLSLIDGIIAVCRLLSKKKTLDDDEKTAMLVLLGLLEKRQKTDNDIKEAMVDLDDTPEFHKVKKLLATGK